MPVVQQICAGLHPRPAWSTLAWPGCWGSQAQGDLAATTETWLHPHVRGHRLLQPACLHPPEQLAWAWRGWKPLWPSSPTPLTSLVLEGNEVRGWGQVVSSALSLGLARVHLADLECKAAQLCPGTGRQRAVLGSTAAED